METGTVPHSGGADVAQLASSPDLGLRHSADTPGSQVLGPRLNGTLCKASQHHACRQADHGASFSIYGNRLLLVLSWGRGRGGEPDTPLLLFKGCSGENRELWTFSPQVVSGHQRRYARNTIQNADLCSSVSLLHPKQISSQ